MTILFTKSAHKALLKLPPKIHAIIIDKLSLLALEQPGLNIRKLTNLDEFRIRVGDYRVIFSKNSMTKEVVILSVSHRKEAYRN